MDNDFNPFPAYPVVRLHAEASQVGRGTVLTPPIVEARSRVERYAQQWLRRQSDPAQQVEANVNAVRGDYGTGKTHLLLDAAAQLQNALAQTHPELRIIRAACLETDRLSWYRSTIGPQLNPKRLGSGADAGPGFIERLMLLLYAEAGRNVAAKAPLTQGAVERLEAEPEAIRGLVKQNLLNMQAVDEEFARLLQAVCQGEASGAAGAAPGEVITVSEDVRRALAAAIWPDTAGKALRWLAAERLSEADRSELRLSGDLTSDEDAAGVLAALAAVHHHLGVPFVLIVDELEHLTRYDKSRRAKANITWLKRLLERLAAHRALVFVSGHWSGWDVEPDFLDRFKPLPPIDLVKLTAEDVLMVVKARVKGLDDEKFGREEAEAVAGSSNGNIRSVLTLCLLLFRDTAGFSRKVTPEKVEELAEQMAKRLSPEAAAAAVRSILEKEGLVARERSVTDDGIKFDLIGLDKDGRTRVVVKFEFAVYQTDLYDAAKVFLDRVERVFENTPDVVACFIVDGNIDQSLLELLKAARPFRLLRYDLTAPEVMRLIADDLHIYLQGDAGGPAPMADPRAAELAIRRNEKEEQKVLLESRIRAASEDANTALVSQLQRARDLVERQLALLNEQLAKREETLRADVLKSLRAEVEVLDAKRTAELQRLYESLEARQREAESDREQELLRKQEVEESPKLHATYADLTRQPPLSAKLRLALAGPQILVLFYSLVGGLVLIFMAQPLAEMLVPPGTSAYNTYRVTFYAFGIAMMFYGVAYVWQRLTRVEAFYDYCARTLREIYIRSQSVQDLVRADNILRDSIEAHGLFGWRRKAEECLRDEFGDMLGRSGPRY